MTGADVSAILGGLPQSRSVVKGRVQGPESFITNSDPGVQTRDGHRDYEFCEWVISHWGGTSYVAVVVDGDKVVCRYLTVGPPSFWDKLRMHVGQLF
jgi:hypothetical protein